MSESTFPPALQAAVDFIMIAPPSQLIELGRRLEACANTADDSDVATANDFMALMVSTASLALHTCVRTGNDVTVRSMAILLCGFAKDVAAGKVDPDVS